jgi:hypothetical protein
MGAINASDLTREDGMDLLDRYGHRVTPLARLQAASLARLRAGRQIRLSWLAAWIADQWVTPTELALIPRFPTSGT